MVVQRAISRVEKGLDAAGTDIKAIHSLLFNIAVGVAATLFTALLGLMGVVYGLVSKA
jgi:hypothetical protein